VATLLDDRDQVDAEALALELASARKVTRVLRKAVGRLIALALAEAAKAKLAADGQLTAAQQEAARDRLNAAIAALAVSLAGHTAAAVAAGISLALDQEKRLLPTLGVTAQDVRRQLERDPVLSGAGAAAQQVLAAAVETVRRAAGGPLASAKDLEAVAGRAAGVTSRVERQVRAVTNRAVNQTAVQIVTLTPPPRPAPPATVERAPLAENLPNRSVMAAQPPLSSNGRTPLVDNGLRVVWVAERGACLTCLALSGRVIDPNSGDGFDEDATFGKPGSAPLVWPPGMPLMGPPRHPNCRCRLRILAAGNVMVPAALRREAERSVARGWSDYDSRRARLGATDRLVRQANRLPRTVNERGARDVARGSFSTRHRPRTNLRVG
jgi:hypothetical protein